MIRVAKLKEYLDEIQSEVEGINFNKLIIDDSELSKFLQEQPVQNEALLLFGVMPDFTMQGSEDSVKMNNKLTFMVLEKTDYSEHDHDSYLSIFERTQEAIRAIFYKFLEDKADGGGVHCSLMTWLSEGSINIYPIWKKNACNGWGMDVDLLTNV